MAQIIRVKPGPVVAQDGTYPELRGGRTGEVVVSHAHARYQEAVYRGSVFGACQFAGTTMPAGLSASPTTLTLANPAGNNKNFAIWYASITNLVAFTAAAIIALAVSTNTVAAAVSGTAVTPVSLLVGSKNASTANLFTTATLPAAPTQTVAILGAGLTGAITTAPSAVVMSRELAGSIILTPGTALSFQASTAGGASGSAAELIWEEIAL